MKDKIKKYGMLKRWGTMLALAGLCLGSVQWAQAASIITSLKHEALPGGEVALELEFTGKAPDPKVFTTDEPARIAVDFANTTSQLNKKAWDIDVGATSGIRLVSSQDRTRMVVSLLRPSSYRSNVSGHVLTFTIGNGQEGSEHKAVRVDPTKKAHNSAVTELTKVDFRRGNDGEGRVLINYSGNPPESRVQTDDGHVMVTLSPAQMAANMRKRLDVADFATPVKHMDIKDDKRGGISLDMAVNGKVVTHSYEDNNQLVISVAKPQKQEVTKNEKAAKQKVYTGSRTTFNFQDIPVRAALQLIAEESHLNLVASDSVSGSVTLKLDNVPWDQALDVILRAKGLDKRRNEDVIWIAPQDELAKYEQSLADARLKREDSAELETSYVPISYGTAKDIASLLTSDAKNGSGSGSNDSGVDNSRGFLSRRGSVSYDDRTNTLLINDTAEKIETIKNLVAVLDKPVKQVLIEARIVAATDTFARELGTRWGLQKYKSTRGGDRNYGIGGSTQSAFDAAGNHSLGLSSGGYNVDLPIADPAGSVALAVLGRHFLIDLELQAAQTEGRTEIISSPRVITANQQLANIQQGQEIGYVTFDDNGDGRSRPDVKFKDAVLDLEVTPTITADERVFLRINVDQDTLDRFIDSPGGGQVPLLNTRSINTSVLVNDGQTVVLGGIYEVNKSSNVSKVPGLGDIPILGALFRKTEKSDSKAELLVFVTPRILTTLEDAE